VKKLVAGLSILTVVACARTATAPPRTATAPPRAASIVRLAAKPAAPVRVVVRDATSIDDFWKATVARPRRITATRGTIRASAVYPDPSPYHSRVRVTDGARTLVDAVVGDVPMGWRFAQLEGHRPVLLYDGFTGGAHCCFETGIVHLGSGERGVTPVVWGDLGDTLVPSASGTGSVFRTGDDQMAYAFSSFAASTFAIKMLAYRGGRMRDVTPEYPALIERDARDQWQIYLERKHEPDANFHASVYPPLVSYLADEYRLGRGPQAWSRVRAANGSAPAFYAHAKAWLRGHGYAP